MDFLRPELQERLMKEHFEFRKLMEEHKSADSRLGDLQKKPSLSAKESLQEASKRADQQAFAHAGEAPGIGPGLRLYRQGMKPRKTRKPFGRSKT